MLLHDLALIFARDLDSLRIEVMSYPDDGSLWVLPIGAPNSAGTLALHLCGNLRHFIGAGLGASGYVRDREAEFNTRGTTRAELAALIHLTRSEVTLTLQSTPAHRLEESMTVGNASLPIGRGLLHLAVHLTYHLGQIDYHRRLVTGDAQGVGALGVAAIAG